MIKLGKKGHRHSARLLPPHIYCIGRRDIVWNPQTLPFLPLFSHKYTILRCKHRVPNLISPARDFLSIQRIHAEKEVKWETLLSRFSPLSQHLMNVFSGCQKNSTSVLRFNLCNLTPDLKPFVQFLCSLSDLAFLSSPWQEMSRHAKQFNIHFMRQITKR